MKSIHSAGNSIAMKVMISSENLYSIIESSFSPSINPVQDYFKALPLIDIGDGSSNGGSYSDSSVPTSFSLKAIPDLASCVASVNDNAKNGEKTIHIFSPFQFVLK